MPERRSLIVSSAECKYEFTNFAHEVTLHNNLAYLLGSYLRWLLSRR